MKKNLAGWVGLVLCLCVVWAGAAWAAPATLAPAKDPKALVVEGFFNCFRGKACPVDQLFAKDMRTNVVKIRARMKPYQLVQISLVSKVPQAFQAKYERTWGRTLKRLSAAGYETKELRKIGMGTAIAQAGPLVSIAFASVTLHNVKTGKVRNEYFYLVMWKIKGSWYIVFSEDFPAGWMARNKPVGFESGKK